MTLLLIDSRQIAEQIREFGRKQWGRFTWFIKGIPDYMRYVVAEIRNVEKDRITTMKDILALPEDATLKAKKSTSYAKQVRKQRHEKTGETPTIASRDDSNSSNDADAANGGDNSPAVATTDANDSPDAS